MDAQIRAKNLGERRSAFAGEVGTAPRRPHANGRADASMARSAAGSLRDQRSAGRWPLSLIAGNRARTLGARFYADSKPSPPRPRAELDSVLANDEHGELNPSEPTGRPRDVSSAAPYMNLRLLNTATSVALSSNHSPFLRLS
jgi:hypothetical protein